MFAVQLRTSSHRNVHKPLQAALNYKILANLRVTPKMYVRFFVQGVQTSQQMSQSL